MARPQINESVHICGAIADGEALAVLYATIACIRKTVLRFCKAFLGIHVSRRSCSVARFADAMFHSKRHSVSCRGVSVKPTAQGEKNVRWTQTRFTENRCKLHKDVILLNQT